MKILQSLLSVIKEIWSLLLSPFRHSVVTKRVAKHILRIILRRPIFEVDISDLSDEEIFLPKTSLHNRLAPNSLHPPNYLYPANCKSLLSDCS